MKYDFKNPKHREALRMLGFSDGQIDKAIKTHFEDHDGTNVYLIADEIFVGLFERTFQKVREYKPDQWNPYPAIQPPNKEAKYLVSYKNESTDVNWWYPDALAWQDLNGQVVAFRALPEAYKPEEPFYNHPDEIAARRYMGEEE